MSLTRPVSSIAIVIALVASMLLATDSVVVASGDTLSGIAAANGVSVAQLVKWNDITDPNLIYAGTQLIVTAPTAAQTATAQPQAPTPTPTPTQQYLVRAGDTLSTIARHFGLTILRVIELNRISNPNLIYAGQTLTLDDSASTPTPASAAPLQHYTVRIGDTLSGIASKLGVSMSALAAANAISDPDRIKAGDDLTIPGAPASLAPPTTTVPPTTTAQPTPTTAPPTTTAPPLPAPPTTAPAPAPANTTSPSITTPPATVPDPSAIGSASLSPLFEHWAAIYSVPQGLIEALAWKESNWQPDAIGPAGHLGIAQLSPDTVAFVEANLLGVRTDPLNASDGIRLEARYFRYLADRTSSERLALAAWNQGLHNLLANGMSETGSKFADEVIAIRDARA